MKYQRLIILFLFVSSKNLCAQLSPADSVFFNQHFAESMYVDLNLFPGNWFVHPEVTSVLDLNSKLLQIFKFNSGDFTNAYENMQVESNFEYDTALNQTFNSYYSLYGNAYRQYDPLIKLDFTLQGKTNTSYSTFTPTNIGIENEIAFFVIPGSNNNQTSEIIIGNGYHNTNCFLKNQLLNYGDVFVHCKPLEDYRALYWNSKKFNSGDYVTPVLNYVYNYQDSLDRPYGINYLIECLAMIKYLNAHYKKVVLIGCSLGGYSSLIASLNCPTDGCIISSGYTNFIETDSTFLYELSQNFKLLPYQYTNSIIKNKISESKSNYLFTWGNYDSYWYQIENATHNTESDFSDLDNCSYFYDYNHHAFPTCHATDTFIQKIISKPKLYFNVIDTLSSKSLEAEIQFNGNGPFSFDVFRDGNLYKKYSFISSTTQLILSQFGNYTIKNITNASGLKGYCVDTIQFNSNYPLASSDEFGKSASFSVQNPFDQTLEIKFASQFQKEETTYMQLMSISGELIYKGRLKKSSAQIDTKSLMQGMYILQIISDGQISTFKLNKR
ncbi:MAG TPA: T9SS type A sorting domain-containing protein [Chitinophagaceae bacterium]|nr:T9SS type A sorting domain-containing protein [Chitinophagaceae bacterium]